MPAATYADSIVPDAKIPAGPGMYSPRLLDHFLRPRNVGRTEVVHGEGHVRSRICQDLLEITVRLGEGGHVEARFRAQGCSACIAGASALTELVNEGGFDELRARAIDGSRLARELDGVPAAKRRCVELAVVALGRALDDAALKGGSAARTASP